MGWEQPNPAAIAPLLPATFECPEGSSPRRCSVVIVAGHPPPVDGLFEVLDVVLKALACCESMSAPPRGSCLGSRVSDD